MVGKGYPTPPIHLNIDITNICSQQCLWCMYQSNITLGGINRDVNLTAKISSERLDKLIEEFVECGIQGVEITGGGEPLIHPYFNTFVESLLKFGIKVGVITNGDFLGKHIDTLSQCLYVRVSITSLSENIHKETRKPKTNTTVADIIKMVGNLNSVKQRYCMVGVGLTIDKSNYKEIYDIVKKAKEIGCNNIRLIMTWVNDPSEYSEIWGEVVRQVERSKEFNNDYFTIIPPYSYMKYMNEKKDFKKCYYPWLTMNITADGECYPCCILRGVKEYSFGNINDESLWDIVYGSKRKNLIRNIIPSKCPVCIWGEKAQFLEYLVEGGGHCEFV